MDAVSKDALIHTLWDELAEFGPARVDAALDHALSRLCELIDAQQGCWFGAVRLGVGPDPIDGWRPAAIRYLHPRPELDAAWAEHRRRIDRGDIDPGILANLRQAGQFRVTIQHELVPPEWYESEFQRTLFAPFGIRDSIYMAMPLGLDVESWLVFERIGERAKSFDDENRMWLDRAGRALKWFHRNVALSHGLMIAERPLTPAERRVLAALLGGESEAAIAERLGFTPASVHTYATRLFRKFNVQGRAGLTSLWLGQPAPPASP